jgi:polyisoprenoid-binding protein YceI
MIVAGSVALAPYAAEAAPTYKAPDTSLSTLQGGTYTLDPTHASIIWRVWHLGYSHFAGRFEAISATAEVNAAKPEASKVSVTIKPESGVTGVAKLDEELKSAMFFDAAKFPEITFTSTAIKMTGKTADGKPKGTIAGTLAMHGVSKPVVLNAVFNGHGVSPFGGGERMGFNATGKLKRSDFGIGALIPMVSDEVTFDIAAEFTKAE